MTQISSSRTTYIQFFKKLHSSTSISTALHSLKINYTFQERCYIVDHLPKNFHNYIYGNPFPKTLKELGEGAFIHNAESLIDEINWLLLTLRKSAGKIKEFLLQKSRFELNFLKGYYRDASEILNSILAEFGESIWLIEVRLLLKEIEKGMDENKLYLSQVTEDKGAHYISIIADLMSRKVEKDRSIHRYQGEFKTFVNRVNGNFGNETAEYYFFKANLYGHPDYKYKTTLLAFEHKSSLIDRYLMLIAILRQYISNGNLTLSERKDLSSRIYYIYRKVGDESLIKLQTGLVSIFPSELTEEEEWANSILNKYTAGEYSTVIEECKRYLKTHLQNFEIYQIYCKALLNSRLRLQPIPGNQNLVNEILVNVYGIIENSDDPEIYARALGKIAYQLTSFSIGEQIINFLHIESDGDPIFSDRSILSNKCYLPSMHHYSGDEEFANEYLDHYNDLVKDQNLTVNFLKKVLIGDLSGIQSMEIPEYRKLFYEALLYQKKGQYEDAIKLWLHLKDSYNSISHIFKAAVEHLFNCYLNSQLYDDALNLYVNTFFRNPYCILRLKAGVLEDELRKSKMKIVKGSINLPLFFSIASSKKTILSNAVEVYLRTCGVGTPSQFIDSLSNGDIVEVDIDKVNFFLNNVCTMSLFTHLVKIKGTKNKLNERLSICVYLLNNDPSSSDTYIKEIDDIERELLIQEGLQEYDESKIFINDKMIKETLLKEFEADYDRYRKYSLLLKNNPKIKFLIGNALFDITSNKDNELDNSVFSSDPLFDQFKQMFLELRDKFLFSQYGLMEFLSGRIRHGVFKSEIRPKFEKLELITERDAITNVYRPSEYWRSKLSPLDQIELNQILNQLAVFSKRIDDLIEEDALKKYLQIKVENRNPEGWFDYEFDDLYLLIVYASFNKKMTFDEFVDKCFAFLYERTDKNLAEIRKKITGEYNDKFEEEISKFEQALRAITPEHNIHEIFTRINDIKVYVQNDLNKVSTWFNRSGINTKDFYIDKIIEISLQHTNRGYEKKEIELIRQNDCETLFKGEFYPYFIDLIRVFFVNILEHNDAQNGKITANLNISENWPMLKISVSNYLTKSDVHSAEHYNKVDEAKSQTEGKSGFPKVKRILKSYLGRKNSDNRLEFPSTGSNEFIVECYINIEELIV